MTASDSYTTLTARLADRSSSQHCSGTLTAALEPNAPSAQPQSPKRILIIDDEAPLRRVIELTLKITAGWEALVASSGLEGLRQAEVELPDVILLDLMMPQMDGIATLTKLRENPATQQIPVVLLTANVQAAEQPQLHQLGVAAVLIKPFDPIKLVEQIKHALNWG